MIKRLFFSLLFLTCTSQVFSEPEKTKRIHSLIPELVSTLNIEPYIPSDLVLVHHRKETEEYFWMPEGLFEKYMADSKSAHRPFLHVIVRKGPKGENSVKEYLSEYGNYFPIQSTSLHWGNYEVTSVKMNATDDDEYTAFVNLNQDDGRFVMFHLGYYKKLDYGNGNKPSKEDLDFWNDFLNKTKSF